MNIEFGRLIVPDHSFYKNFEAKKLWLNNVNIYVWGINRMWIVSDRITYWVSKSDKD